MSFNRTNKRGYVDQRAMTKGPNGRNLCRWCSVEVEPPRRTFCSDACVHEHRLRSSPGYLRDCTFERDHGVCALCQRNCSSRADHVKAIKATFPRENVDLSIRANWRRWLAERTAKVSLELATRQIGDGSGWDADHIVPVVEGGGECGLDNIRTLCRPCHKLETAALAKRRASARRAK